MFIRGDLAGSKHTLQVLLDTGAVDSNYIKASVVDKLVNDNVNFTYHTCNKLVCSAFNSCVKITKKNVYFSVTLTI